MSPREENMNFVCESKERKRCREEETAETVKGIAKAQKYESEVKLKAPCCVINETSLMEKPNEEVRKVEEKTLMENSLNNGGVPENWEETVMSWEEWLLQTSWSFNEEQIMGYPYLNGEVLTNAGFTYPYDHDDEEIVWEDDVWNLKNIKEVPK